MNDNVQISEERLAEFKEAFEIFDEDKDGFVSIKRLTEIFQTLGHDPTQEDIKNMVRELKIVEGKINFHEFVKLMAQKTKDNMIEEEIIEAFKVFDKRSEGKIHWEDLKNILKGNIGEDISDEELSQIIQAATNEGEYIAFNELVKNHINK